MSKLTSILEDGDAQLYRGNGIYLFVRHNEESPGYDVVSGTGVLPTTWQKDYPTLDAFLAEHGLTGDEEHWEPIPYDN